MHLTLARPINDKPNQRAIVCPVSGFVRSPSPAAFSPSQIVFRFVIASAVLISGLAPSACLPPLLVIASRLLDRAFSNLRRHGLGSPFLLSFPIRTQTRRLTRVTIPNPGFFRELVYELLWPCPGKLVLLPSVPMRVAPPGFPCQRPVAQYVSLMYGGETTLHAFEDFFSCSSRCGVTHILG